MAEALVIDAQFAPEGGARQGLESDGEALAEQVEQGRLGDVAGGCGCIAGADAQVGGVRVVADELDGEGVGSWSAAMLEGAPQGA